MDLPPLLDALLRAEGPAGYEEPASAVWRDAADFAEQSSDRIGSSIARVGDAAPVLAVVGHIDEIGFVVNHIDEHGFLWFNPIGYWDPNIVSGQRVSIRSEGGTVLGVVGRRPKSLDILSGDEQLGKQLLMRELHIDIGASSREEAATRVRVGDPVVIAAEPARVTDERFVSRAMDDRLGAYIALESLRRCAEGDGPGGSFAAVASVQEELGLRGAQTSVHRLKPDVAIAVDVFFSSDAPTIEERDVGDHPLGSGAIIGRGPTLSPVISQLLVEVAEAEGIPYTLGGYGLAGLGLSTGTDADAMQIAGEGIATGVVSIPLRYMHTPVEMVDLRDVEACVQLLAAFGSRLDSGVDLDR